MCRTKGDWRKGTVKLSATVRPHACEHLVLGCLPVDILHLWVTLQSCCTLCAERAFSNYALRCCIVSSLCHRSSYTEVRSLLALLARADLSSGGEKRQLPCLCTPPTTAKWNHTQHFLLVKWQVKSSFSLSQVPYFNPYCTFYSSFFAAKSLSKCTFSCGLAQLQTWEELMQ